MVRPVSRTTAEWFAAVEHGYLEKHQGCASCGGRHCVFRTETEQFVEYYCYACDFSVCRNTGTGRHFVWSSDQPTRQPAAILEEALHELIAPLAP